MEAFITAPILMPIYVLRRHLDDYQKGRWRFAMVSA